MMMIALNLEQGQNCVTIEGNTTRKEFDIERLIDESDGLAKKDMINQYLEPILWE